MKMVIRQYSSSRILRSRSTGALPHPERILEKETISRCNIPVLPSSAMHLASLPMQRKPTWLVQKPSGWQKGNQVNGNPGQKARMVVIAVYLGMWNEQG